MALRSVLVVLLSIKRGASFGHIHNRRSSQLARKGRRIESYREHFKPNGASHSAWRERWVRVD